MYHFGFVSEEKLNGDIFALGKKHLLTENQMAYNQVQVHETWPVLLPNLLSLLLPFLLRFLQYIEQEGNVPYFPIYMILLLIQFLLKILYTLNFLHIL